MKAPLQPVRSFSSAATVQRIGNNSLKTIIDNRSIMVTQRKLQAVIQQKSVRGGMMQMMAPIQMMKWPGNRKSPKVTGTLWAKAELDEIKSLYEACENMSIFDRITNSIDPQEWESSAEAVKEAIFVGAKDNEDEDLKSLFAYRQSKVKAARVLKHYNNSSYKFPSAKADELMRVRGIVIADYGRQGLQASLRAVSAADLEYEAHLYEKTANTGAFTIQERTALNKQIDNAVDKLLAEVTKLAIDKADLDKKEADEAKHLAAVNAMIATATTIPSFTKVLNNTLAKSIWEASISNAGKTGYLQVDNTVYPKAAVVAATTALKKFSREWNDIHSAAPKYLSNPHTPGKGIPQDKTGHANFDLRTSKYQADFITTWNGADTVMHINSDS